MINILVVFILSKLSYNSNFQPKYQSLIKKKENLEKRNNQILTDFRKKYRMIEKEGAKFFKSVEELSKLKKRKKLDIPIPADYLVILQKRIFINKNINFKKNIKKQTLNALQTSFVNWWDNVSAFEISAKTIELSNQKPSNKENKKKKKPSNKENKKKKKSSNKENKKKKKPSNKENKINGYKKINSSPKTNKISPN